MQTRVQFTHIPSWGGGLKPAEESFISAISNLQNRAQNQWFKHTHSFFKYTNWAATKFPQGEPQTKDQSLSPLPSYSRISFFLFLSPFTNENPFKSKQNSNTQILNCLKYHQRVKAKRLRRFQPFESSTKTSLTTEDNPFTSTLHSLPIILNPHHPKFQSSTQHFMIRRLQHQEQVVK